MRRQISCLFFVFLVSANCRLVAAQRDAKVSALDVSAKQKLQSIERGKRAVKSVVAPFSLGKLDNVWQAWGLKAKPKDFDQQVLKRYGLIAAPQKDNDFPIGLKEFKSAFGNGTGENCLFCHAGSIAGQTIIGLGNASLDAQSLLEDLNATTMIKMQLPFALSTGRGVIEAAAGSIFLLRMRDSELNRQLPNKLEIQGQLNHDLPAWWLRKRKQTMFHTGSTSVMSVRSNLSFLMTPTNDAKFIKSQEPKFRDIKNYIMSLDAPKYPFPIDKQAAGRGELFFNKTCSECHGTYGKDREYPNRIVPLDEIGTDRRLAEFTPIQDLKYYQESWIYRETGPDGEPLHLLNHGGYQAPPLDGVWATAPYFHNASVPTISHVLNSKTRPKVFTRSFKTHREAYDEQRLGWKTTQVDASKLKTMSKWERRRVTNTSDTGRGNGGHTFGDKLTDTERNDLLEYLKSL
jgi:hypothetical protein